MEKRNLQKINKAAVATVLAASGITISAPAVPTKASGFTDLNPEADNYKPILELYNRGYISGYKDGTFRPNQAVTRGQAAKMLAQALNLNMTNPKNPRFSDVPTSNGFYQYIAALAGAGIITGYSDQTFRPNEPITRNQMAKILTLGYKFQQSTKLTHDFRDVAESNPNRFYIQTLYDLGITKGTTQITYSPYGSVTRGQLATFIYRAENTTADAVKPVKEISSISGSSVYINGIAYRVDASLRDLINETNAPALKGAHIEGQIIGETLKSISSLTLNAEGNKNRILVLDGNYSTFTGELTIQGNYIRLKNWTITGQVKITEAPRRTLSNLAGPLSNLRVASLSGFGFIDWSKPTDTTEEDDDPSYNDGGHDLETKPPILPGGNVVEKMPVTEKFVDFTNCSVSRLIIEANRTHIEAAKTIPQLTVRGWVRQFEVYANIDTLYIETDVATTMYGVGNINKIYKNSYKNVYLNSSGHANLLVVDNTGGKIDLGDNFYVDKVIIPPNKMPNDIFNDFIKDNDKIGDIEDPNGNDVDRDPIEDTIIPDWEEPAAQIVRVDVDGTNAKAQITSTEKGRYYFTVKRKDEKPPSIREILDDAKTTTLKTSGQGMIGADLKATFDIAGLVEMTDYTLYVVVSDEAGNYSDKVSKDFTTMDGTPPVITNLDALPLPGGKRADVTFNASESGRYYYRVVPKVADTTPPTVKEVMESSGALSGTGKANAGSNSIRISGLTHLTEYVIYMVMEDDSGNLTTNVVSDIFTTRELDDILPTVSPDIKIVGSTQDEPTVIQLTFSEPMDKETAENVKNYILSGTGNLTGNPYTAKLESNGRVVTLTIPSMAAFVNNDTLIVTVQNVTDIAGNAILKGASTSVATYRHQSNTKPVIESLEAKDMGTNTDGNTLVKTEFTTKLTGTYYYMIVPVAPSESAPPSNTFKEPTISEVVFPKDYQMPTGIGDDKKVDINTKMPNTPIVLDNQTVLFGKGTANELTNSFQLLHPKNDLDKNKTGYKIYMVLQDRNGNYSLLKQADYIRDEEKPQILKNKSYFVNPNDKSSSYELFFYPDNYVPNTVQTFEFHIKFSEPMDPTSMAKRENYRLEGLAGEFLNVSSVTMGEDSSTAVLKLQSKVSPAFIEYLIKHDYNLTIKVDGVYDFNKLQFVNDEVSFKYTDKVKPILKEMNSEGIKALRDYSVSLSNDDLYIKLSFSENIKDFPADGFEIMSSTGTKTYTVANVAYAKDEKSKDIKNELILKVGEGATGLVQNEDLKITVNEKVKDEQGNSVYTVDNKYNQAIYRYRNISAVIDGTELDPSNMTSTGGVKTSRSAYIVTTISNMGSKAKFYYVVLPSRAEKPKTLQDIISYSNSADSSAYGSATVETPGTRQLLDAVVTSGNPNAVFVEGYTLYLIVIDEYNNISTIQEKKIDPPPASANK
ncbi:S-layer homology domain-containing protein [Lysinibacillus odysseyi]|uniref:S-layer homology domain-containing protein n=1 Tax=Lysinibacillus odysseyi TaxID=202611 RepID=UPI0006903161|nr:S-layer homology domain-containing protein [Lysinibacillus odysseyi]